MGRPANPLIPATYGLTFGTKLWHLTCNTWIFLFCHGLRGLAIYIRNPSADMGGKLADLNLVPEVKDTILSPLEVVCSPMFRVGYSVEVHDDI